MQNVTKSKPLSVKFSSPTRTRLKNLCHSLGKSENALVNEAVESVLEMIEQGKTAAIPKLVVLARTALDYEHHTPLIQSESVTTIPFSPELAVQGHDLDSDANAKES